MKCFRGEDGESMEKELEKFRDILKECTNYYCVWHERVDGQIGNTHKWCSEEVGEAVAKTGGVFVE